MRPSSSRRVSYASNDWISNPVLIIIVVNLMVYIATLNRPDLIRTTLGLIPLVFLERPWTVITAMFTHAGFGHIFWNMLTLFFFGRVVYKAMGGWRFLLVYFCGGIAGNLLFYWLGNPLSIVVGASGAIFALTGTLVVLAPNMRVYLWFLIPIPLWVMVLVFFLIGSFVPGVAWQAHLGGLAVGLIAGFVYRRQMRYIIDR